MKLNLRSLYNNKKVEVRLDRNGLRIKGYFKKTAFLPRGTYVIDVQSFPNMQAKQDARVVGLAGSLLLGPLVGLAAMAAKSVNADGILAIKVATEGLTILLTDKNNDATMKSYIKMVGS